MVGKTTRRLIKDIIHNPGDPELWFGLGSIFGSKADLALTFYYTAYRIAPSRSKYIDMLARIIVRMGDIDAAMKLMDDALGSLDRDTDEYALLQCYKEDIALSHRVSLIRGRLGIDW